VRRPREEKRGTLASKTELSGWQKERPWVPIELNAEKTIVGLGWPGILFRLRNKIFINKNTLKLSIKCDRIKILRKSVDKSKINSRLRE
jgi:hypothetical protein